MKNENANGKEVSLQISMIGEITEELFNLPTKNAFLIKNITEDILKVEIKPASCNYFIETTIYPGWNPELVTDVKNATIKTLQYGY